MVKNFIVLVLLMTGGTTMQAQVNFIFNANAFGHDMKGLSTVQVINTSPESYTGSLEIEVKGLATYGTVVKLLVTQVSILQGNNIIPPSKFSSAVVTYASSREGNYLKQTGMMPEGELEYCFKLNLLSKNNTQETYENCFTGTNIAASPLQLVTPDNGERFCNKRPGFTWQPSLPLRPGTTYSLKLVEIKKGQAPAEAVLVNTPVIYQANIRGFVIQYPAGTPDLREGNTYAWQVTSQNKGQQAVSEVWQFSVQCDSSERSPASYRELTAADDGGYLTTGSSLRVAVNNPYIEVPLKYVITSLEDPSKKIKGLPEIQLKTGMNNIQINLNKVAGIRDDSEYLLEVWLPDGKKVSLRFKYDSSAE